MFYLLFSLQINAGNNNANGMKRYADETKIGEGGTAEVYRAFDTRLNRDVALKRYKENQNWEGNEDYRWELETASRIHHHNIVTTYDANSDEKGKFMVMEYIEGKNLQDLAAEKPMDLERFCNFAIQALDGLGAAHKGGLLHLDIKPANVMLSKEGGHWDHVKLIDFGRARASQDPDTGDRPTGSGLNGSIYFVSPEHLHERTVDCRSDLYSLGCSFYWALTRELPFRGQNAFMVMNAHIEHHVEDLYRLAPHLPRKLTTWVMSLIAADPSRRPQDVDEALDAFYRRHLNEIHPHQVA